MMVSIMFSDYLQVGTVPLLSGVIAHKLEKHLRKNNLIELQSPSDTVYVHTCVWCLHVIKTTRS